MRCRCRRFDPAEASGAVILAFGAGLRVKRALQAQAADPLLHVQHRA